LICIFSALTIRSDIFFSRRRMQFLERDPRKRLGCRPNGQGILDIEQHPWFRPIDWAQLNEKALTPPFVPDVRVPCPRRVSSVVLTRHHPTQQKKPNFDVSHELDEFLMVEKPLTHTKRKANPDLEKMKPELRQMEEQSVSLSPAPSLRR
jgi:serine/threonine kinase 32